MAPTHEPGTPQAAAVAWVDAVMDRGDLGAAWPGTDPLLRLVLAQDWVWNHRHDPAIGHGREWDAIARELAATSSTSPLWPRFAADLVGTWKRTWHQFDTRSWTVSAVPEVIDLDVEMVTFSERDGALSRRFAMRHVDGTWLVASVDGEQIFEPGWPPRLGRPAGA
jgi:hypothetical protein